MLAKRLHAYGFRNLIPVHAIVFICFHDSSCVAHREPADIWHLPQRVACFSSDVLNVCGKTSMRRNEAKLSADLSLDTDSLDIQYTKSDWQCQIFYNQHALVAKVANKACAARVRQREQEMMKTRIRNMKPQALGKESEDVGRPLGSQNMFIYHPCGPAGRLIVVHLKLWRWTMCGIIWRGSGAQWSLGEICIWKQHRDAQSIHFISTCGNLHSP